MKKPLCCMDSVNTRIENAVIAERSSQWPVPLNPSILEYDLGEGKGQDDEQEPNLEAQTMLR